MQASFNNIVQHLFHQPSLHSVTVDELENMTEQHPYFAAAHFLLLKKMQDLSHPGFSEQLLKTTLYFNNPLWLQYLLQPDTVSNFTVLEKSPFIINDSESLSPDTSSPVYQQQDEEILAEKEPRTETESTVPVTLHEESPVVASAGIMDVITEVFSNEDSNLPAVNAEHAVENDVEEKNKEGEALHVAEESTPTAQQTEHLQENSIAAIEQDNQPQDNRPHYESIIDQIRQANQNTEKPLVKDEPVTAAKIVEEVLPAATNIDSINAPHQSLELAENSVEESISPVLFLYQIPFVDAPVNTYVGHLPVEEKISQPVEQIVSKDEENIPAAVIDEPTVIHVPVLFLYDIPFVETVNKVEETPIAIEESPQIATEAVNESPVSHSENLGDGINPLPGADQLHLKTIIETPAAKDDMLFEPFHTVDYFASQGIKLSKLELNSKDKLGSQLKSFTEWLKSMKRLPQVSIDKILSENDESKVVADAIHSVENKEVITEAMAEVFEKQGLFDRAAGVYRKLSLLNPEKSAYFAAKIEALKQN